MPIPKILIVDDNETNRYSLANLLGGPGREVITVASGQVAVLQVLKHRFSLILLDVEMPGMDGFETAQLIMSNTKMKDIPIIFISGVYRSEDFVRQGFEAGAFDYITKPIEPFLLKSKVEVFLKLYQQQQEIKEINNTLEQKIAERTAEIAQKNDQLLVSNEKLEKMNHLKNEFLANVSHELRTPLNSVMGYSEVLLDQLFGTINEKQKEHISIIYESGKSLLLLINNILDLSKIESGKMAAYYSSFSLWDTMEKTIATVEPLKKDKDIVIRNRVSQEFPETTADQGKLKQILLNLLSNAIKFISETSKGEIRIDAEEIDRKGTRFHQISISDNGVGIKQEDQSVIFQEFRQIRNVAAKEYQGTGLGLALTKKLVELHGGKIWFESEFGKGSTFTFRIPVNLHIDEQSQTLPEDSQVSHGIEQGKKLVMIIDDDLSAAELLQIYLGKEGYETFAVYNPRIALRKAKELKPFAITLDILMPEVDGWEVLSSLKSDPETEDIPVIVCSMVEDREVGMSLGAVDYFVKPVDKTKLIKRLKILDTIIEKDEKIKILIIDDSHSFVTLMQDMLEPEGYVTIPAFGGKEGIEIIKKDPPDIILLDLLMPEVDGFQVLLFIKSDEKTRSIPIIIMTGQLLKLEEKSYLNRETETILEKSAISKELIYTEIKSILNKIAGRKRVDE